MIFIFILLCYFIVQVIVNYLNIGKNYLGEYYDNQLNASNEKNGSKNCVFRESGRNVSKN